VDASDSNDAKNKKFSFNSLYSLPFPCSLYIYFLKKVMSLASQRYTIDSRACGVKGCGGDAESRICDGRIVSVTI